MLEFFFASIDSLFSFAPLWVRLCIWGTIFGAGTMLSYALFSDQERIGAIKAKVEEARAELQAYDGTDLEVLGNRTKRALSLSTKQLKVMLVPTMMAGIPILAGLVWMEGAYSYDLPDPGDEVEVQTRAASGEEANVQWEPQTAVVDQTNDQTTLRWPSSDAPVRLVDQSTGDALATLPLDHPRILLSQKSWIHWLYANPAGYLPDDGPVASVHLELPYRTVLPFGPTWLRTWHVLFMTVLSVAAVIVKVAFGID